MFYWRFAVAWFGASYAAKLSTEDSSNSLSVTSVSATIGDVTFDILCAKVDANTSGLGLAYYKAGATNNLSYKYYTNGGTLIDKGTTYTLPDNEITKLYTSMSVYLFIDGTKTSGSTVKGSDNNDYTTSDVITKVKALTNVTVKLTRATSSRGRVMNGTNAEASEDYEATLTSSLGLSGLKTYASATDDADLSVNGVSAGSANVWVDGDNGTSAEAGPISAAFKVTITK